MYLKTSNFDDIVALKATSGVSPQEGKRLAYLAARVPDAGVIVEIGSCWGRSAAYMASALRESDVYACLYCIDLWDLGDGRTPERHHSPAAFPQFESNLTRLDLWNFIHPIKGDSAQEHKKWHLPIDLLYIDGGHKYDEVLADYLGWKKFVKPGGTIVFHDYNHKEIRNMINQNVKPSKLWKNYCLSDRLWSAQRDG